MLPKEGFFAFCQGTDAQLYKKSIAAFGSLDAFFVASEDRLIRMLGIRKDRASRIRESIASLSEDHILKELDRHEITLLPITSDEYPPLLKELYDPPPCLFLRGTLKPVQPHIAIVGPRKCSTYGSQMAKEFSGVLAAHGLCVVSGLALGIDGIAHTAALEQSAHTVAVLGSGIDDASLYPRAHRGLAHDILANGGALLSEYPPGSPGTKYTFPMRNRIIAGLSAATLVVEAGKKSGALITARAALDANRDVFAIPQNVTGKNAYGVNVLIRDGAIPALSADDILKTFSVDAKPNDQPNSAAHSPIEKALLDLLSREPMHVDVLAEKTGFSQETINANLVLLELAGAVARTEGMQYILATRV